MFVKKKSTILFIALGISSLMGSLQPAEAAIFSASGNASQENISGVNLDNGGFENNSLVVGFDELQDVVVSTPINVDYLISASDIGNQFTGVNNPPGNPPQLGNGTYDSHILHFDPVSNGGSVSNATFTFDGDIVAIIANTTFQVNTDPLFGAAAAYNPGIDRRTENADRFTIVSANTIQIDTFATGGSAIDDLRVITETPITATPVPEPTTLSSKFTVVVLGAFLFLNLKKKRKSQDISSLNPKTSEIF